MGLHFRALQNFSLYWEETHNIRWRSGSSQCHWFKAMEKNKHLILFTSCCAFSSRCFSLVFLWESPVLWSIHILFDVYLRHSQSSLLVDCIWEIGKSQQDFSLDWDWKWAHKILHCKLCLHASVYFSIWSSTNNDKSW